MGGSVAVTLRESDGKEHRMCRWTNIMPFFISNLKLVKEDKEHIRGFTDHWQTMVDTYESGEDSEAISHSEAACYAPYGYLAPCSYGLIVVDMQNKKILSCNDYHNTGHMSAISVRHDTYLNENGALTLISTRPIKKMGKRVFYLDDDNLTSARFYKFAQEGRVLEAENYMTKEKINLQDKTPEELIDLIISKDATDWDLKLDFSPYEVVKYDRFDSESIQKMKSDIEALGFELSDKEEQLWDEYINGE
jgi:hypothetical protein